MASKKSNPYIEKMEEKQGKDLDGDGEKGEPATHQKKVLGESKKRPPMQKLKTAKQMPGGKGRPAPMMGKSGKLCAACKAKKMSSCNH